MQRNTEATQEKTPSQLNQAEIVQLESRNALRQFDAGIKLIEDAVSAGGHFSLRVSHICGLNRIATEGVHTEAGRVRSAQVQIKHSSHTPPDPQDVQKLLEDMCDDVNANANATPIHIAALILWKLNWIHPFCDGNGRTSRMLSYVMLCIRLGFVLPGKTTIPEQIVAKKELYYNALESADAAWKKGKVDVRHLEEMLEEMLAVQLHNIQSKATGMDEIPP